MKIYFSASVTGGRDDEDIYSKIVDLLLTYGDVLDKHIGYKTVFNNETQLTPKDIFDRCIKWMEACEICFAEVSNPSMGVGFELAYLDNLNKPVFCFYRNNSPKKISPIIEGNKNFKIFKYDKFEEVENEIARIFNKL